MRKVLSLLYRSVITMRNRLYDTGVLTVHRVDVPVVSVGNIEVGGTGKTPFTIALVRDLLKEGLHPVIVTRGYRGRLKGTMQVLPDHRYEDVGDEPLLMTRISGAAVVKSPDRVKGAAFAREALDADIVVLDDGFQHRRIYRDLDIVLVSRDLSGEETLPFGRLREPVESLRRADIVVRTKGANGTGLSAELVPSSLVDASGQVHDLSVLRDRKVLGFCGIARPRHFIQTLESLGAVVEPLFFPDHHPYTPRDVERIEALSQGKDFAVTTEKDLVRLDSPGNKLALRVEMRVSGMSTILQEIEGIVKKSRISRQG